ncbi:hypothetical protein METBIDRAFT_11408 [Metschnikowia bicuspidata var. bicuspidata NRRL YB-4993]|uniref:GATA-type domain-containing protein n=1 Tax=Metschnikowia bicuspidata var. bicuspidata NRRL YB-4993 TaxID=869754 RepID=A0A1A0HF32_9ASCO|nr:hypothetical protein METBIDRAFT_11408 [Metschnikowia bicuspidata var. bicuspidata NRRL YB-4993]OBA22590.1 hypothetical protein METBIDRAFT_11408 [Metschnikowia bicuspidata var. bicuspidata NRRL YB-4993]
MSVLRPPMYPNQLDRPFAPGRGHGKTASFGQLFSGLTSQRAARKVRSESPHHAVPPGPRAPKKRRSHDDGHATHGAPAGEPLPALKRPRTVPSLPISSRACSPMHVPVPPRAALAGSVTLPSLSDALGPMPDVAAGRKPSPKARPPTVSLDYFDTYMPNDEHWRFGLLDSIRHSKPAFSLDKYAYLNRHACGQPNLAAKPGPPAKPCFDSRTSCKAVPTFAQRKINFPYESSYTYLNSTYLHDVQKFPEYMELARLLVQLSRPPDGLQSPTTEACSLERLPTNAYSLERLPTNAHAHPQKPPSPLHAAHHVGSLSTARPLPLFSLGAHGTPQHSFEGRQHAPHAGSHVASHRTHFIPITPPSVKDKTRLELMKSPPRPAQGSLRICISCGTDLSPCWRPSWSCQEGQLCNSCGLRYKKTAARCLKAECKKIPAKGEWALMQSKGTTTYEDGKLAYGCLSCGGQVELKR